MIPVLVGLLLVAATIAADDCSHESSVPLGRPSEAKIDSALLGGWTCFEDEDADDASDVQIRAFGDHEYLIELHKPGGHDHFRGFVTDLDGRQFMNLQGTGRGAPFVIVGYEFASPDELVVRTIRIGMKPDKPSSTEDLAAAFRERTAAATLFDTDSMIQCTRHPPSSE